MKADWKECPRGDVVPHWSGMYITMNPRGRITLNRVAFERAGSPDAFLLLFDKVNNRIGLKPAARGIRNAYPVAVSGRHGGRVVRAYRLTQEFGIELPQTMQFDDAEIDREGILVLDLRTARVSPRARARRKAAG